MTKMFVCKIIGFEVENKILTGLREALRDFIIVPWRNKESDLQRLNEQDFIKEQGIDSYFPKQINLGGEVGTLEIEENKKVFSYEQIEKIVEHVKENPALYFNKKEKNYDFKEIKSKLQLSRDQILYFIALVEEKSLLRFGYRKDFYLIPVDLAEDVLKMFAAKKNVAGFNKDITEQVQASNAIKEIKDQLAKIVFTEESEEENRLTEEKGEEDIFSTIQLKEQDGPLMNKSNQDEDAAIKLEEQINEDETFSKVEVARQEKDPLVENIIKFISRTGDGWRELKRILSTPAEPEKPKEVHRPKKEFADDDDFFAEVIRNFPGVDIEDFFKPSTFNNELSRLSVLTNDFKNFTLKPGLLAEKKLLQREQLSKVLFSELRRELGVSFNKSYFLEKKTETLVDILLAFNDPALAAEIDELIKSKIGLLARTAGSEAAELRKELILLHQQIINKFADTFTHQKLQKKGGLVDLQS